MVAFAVSTLPEPNLVSDTRSESFRPCLSLAMRVRVLASNVTVTVIERLPRLRRRADSVAIRLRPLNTKTLQVRKRFQRSRLHIGVADGADRTFSV